MEVTYDPSKSEANIRKHGVSFDMVRGFDFETALIDLDDRDDYGEDRMIGLGFIGLDLFVLVFVEAENGVRVISLRPATRQERNRYAEA